MLMAQHGWWFPEQESTTGNEGNPFGVWQTNVNTLLPYHINGKLGFGAPYKNLMCNIKPLSENYDVDMQAFWEKFKIEEA